MDREIQKRSRRAEAAHTTAPPPTTTHRVGSRGTHTATQKEQETLNEAIQAMGAPSVSAILVPCETTVLRAAAGHGVRPGSLALIRVNMSKLVAALEAKRAA